jgi:hypothetical protein
VTLLLSKLTLLWLLNDNLNGNLNLYFYLNFEYKEVGRPAGRWKQHTTS